jgi:uncharacterized protein
MADFDLRRLRLRSGEEHREQIELPLEPLELGGQRYLPVPEKVPAELVVTKASTGTVLQLRFRTRLHGPCFRCLDDAVVEESISGREYQATRARDGDELATPYVHDDLVDLSQWARDAMVLALPDKILCMPDCPGLCPVCGKNLKHEPHVHAEEPTDSRWAALEALKDRL